MFTIEFIQLAAVVSAAVYGVLLAARKGLDVVGVLSVAFIVSFGGGTLRDLVLDRHPLFWIANDHYVAIVMLLAIVGAIVPRQYLKLEKFLIVPDALGLALFTITGAAFSLQSPHTHGSLFIASLLGTVTGTFGGVLADIICNEIPSLFRSAPLYATCSFTGAWIYVLLEYWQAPQAVAASVAFAVIFGMRMAAVVWDIRLPNAKLD